MSNNPSSTTKVLPVRVENDLLGQLDGLLERFSGTRTELARQALRRGLEIIAAELAEPTSAKSATKGKSAAKGKSKASGANSAAVKAPPEAEMDLALFAVQVIEAGQRTKTGRFGDDRVFINHVWRQFKREHKLKGMDLEAFKKQLVEANRQRLLSLACADMAPQLDQKDVKESEARYRSATFHFLSL